MGIGFALVVNAAPVLSENTEADPLTVLDLRKDGWKVIEKKRYIEVRSGLNAYSNLKRYVQVEVYIFEKNENLYKCKMEYDSQNDTLTDKCLKF